MSQYIGDIIFWSAFIVLAVLFVSDAPKAVQLIQGVGGAYSNVETGLIGAVKGA